jgi:hypothetical protein
MVVWSGAGVAGVGAAGRGELLEGLGCKGLTGNTVS